MRKSTIYGLLSAREQREHGWSFLRNNDAGGSGDDGGASGGTDDRGDDGGTDDAPDDDTKTDDTPKGKTFDEKYVKQLRDEAAANRTQLNKVLDAINAAVNPDAKKGEKADPVKLAEQIAAKDTELHSAKVEIAVLKSAARYGGDPVALTDSREFMAKVARLDTTADNFATKVADAIKKAVTDNPRYAAGEPVKRVSGGPIKNGRPPVTDDKARGVDRLRNAYQTSE